MPTTLDASSADFDARLDEWLASRRPGGSDEAVRARVSEIIADVRERGDDALLDWTERLDGHRPVIADLEVATERVWASVEQAGDDVVRALEVAHAQIERWNQALVPADQHPFGDDGPAFQRAVPVERVGIYVPGGRAAYPSSVLMAAVPARVAGVEEIVMVCPAPQGRVPEPVLAAAAIAGVDRVFPVGGAQAVAALAYGTATVPRVDVIVGPGNAWVAEAKRQVFGAVGIDMIAGPSEVLVAIDDPTLADLAAADLLAQAEHDPEAIPILLCPDEDHVGAVRRHLDRRLADLPRAAIAAESWGDRGLILIVEDRDRWVSLCDRIAPEHLELLGAPAEALAPALRYAGAVFVGPYSPEALGDYAAGPDHVLPTAGAARYASPLGPEDFVRRMSVLRYDEAASGALREAVTTLARAEGLEGHARSMEARFPPPADGGPAAGEG